MSLTSPSNSVPDITPVDHTEGLAQRALVACDAIIDRATAEGFAGYDPYDGLTSRRILTRPLQWTRWGRLALIQAVRRSSYNLRPLLDIPPLVNPKTLALLMEACCDLHAVTADTKYKSLYDHMSHQVLQLASKGWSGSCWGYPFPWQARAFYFPAWTPTSVCTSFVARAFLAGYSTWKRPQDLEIARSSCLFLATDLNQVDTPFGLATSYSPLDKAVVHNAYALTAMVLTRVADIDPASEGEGLGTALYNTLIRAQEENGSWRYGLAPHHQWIDTLHTGYVLESLWSARALKNPSGTEAAFLSGMSYFNGTCFSEGRIREKSDRPQGYFEMHTAAEVLRTILLNHKGHEVRHALVERILAGTSPDGGTADTYGGGKWHTQLRHGFLRWSRAWAVSALARWLHIKSDR